MPDRITKQATFPLNVYQVNNTLIHPWNSGICMWIYTTPYTPEDSHETYAAHETHLLHLHADLMTRAGLPTATLRACISRFTTGPAPMEHPWPMVTPTKIVTLAPIQQSSPMTICPVNSSPLWAFRDSIPFTCENLP